MRGPQVTQLERARWKAIAGQLRGISLASDGLIPDFLPSAMADVLRCERFCVYRPELGGEGWGISVHGGVNFDAAFVDAYNTALRETTSPFWYDPLHPRDGNNDRVVLLNEVHKHGPETVCPVEGVWPKVGLSQRDQIRVLLCEGDTTLAWVGGFREEPFTPSERASFEALVPTLRRALSLRRRLADACVARAGLAAALEALGAPAFIVHRSGRVAHVNTAGRALLEQWGRDAPATLKAILFEENGPAFVEPIQSPGVAPCFLVVLREARATRDARLASRAALWKLTPREVDVLRLLSTGDSNKEIAIKLSCSEGSIERHLTSILRKARCDSRSRLVARFWSA